ncbi:MAG: hypothetical protein M3Z31_03690 [Pseudomonadota bacterium]|nr:hypothetical protein [Pseudomonadota bacterium]
MATKTHTITHSPLFARMLGTAASQAFARGRLQHELLHGVAAQDAFIALFDGFDDFDEMAREATQAPLVRADLQAPRLRASAASQRGAGRRGRKKGNGGTGGRGRTPGETTAAR